MCGQGTEEGEKKEDTQLFRKPTDDEHFAGLAFKIMTDPFVGSLTFVRGEIPIELQGPY